MITENLVSDRIGICERALPKTIEIDAQSGPMPITGGTDPFPALGPRISRKYSENSQDSAPDCRICVTGNLQDK